MRWLGGVTDSMDRSLSEFQETVKTEKPDVLQSEGSQRAEYDWATEHRQQINVASDCLLERDSRFFSLPASLSPPPLLLGDSKPFKFPHTLYK